MNEDELSNALIAGCVAILTFLGGTVLIGLLTYILNPPDYISGYTIAPKPLFSTGEAYLIFTILIFILVFCIGVVAYMGNRFVKKRLKE